MEDDKKDGQLPPDPNADGGGEKKPDGERTFSQDELNAIVADRLKRQKGQFADYDDLKTQAGQWDEHQKAQMSELEKATTALATMETQRDEARQQEVETQIRSAFISEAARAGVAHPEDAYLLAELDVVKVGDDGKVAGVAEAVKALATAGRLVLAKPRAPGLDGGAGSGDRSGDKLPALSGEEVQIAQKMGIPLERYQQQKALIEGRGGRGEMTDLDRAQVENARLRAELRKAQK